MAKRMTVVFDDDALYTHLKVEAARTNRAAKDIVAEALVLFFSASRAAGEAPVPNGATPIDEVLRELGLHADPAPATRRTAR